MSCLGITEAMRTAQAAAIDVFLGIPPLHLQLEGEARAEIYRHLCSDQWKHKTEVFGQAYVTQVMKMEPILQIGTR
jgi:hypothetical protein